MAASFPTPRPGHQVAFDDIYTTKYADNLDDLNARLAVVEQGVTGQAIQTVAQSIVTATDTPITLDAETLDPNGWHSTVTNNSRLIPSIAGYYALSGKVSFAASAVGVRIGFLRMNGTTAVDGSGSEVAASSAIVYMIPLAGGIIAHFNGSTDYVELMINHTVGSNLNTAVTGNQRSILTWSLVQRD